MYHNVCRRWITLRNRKNETRIYPWILLMMICGSCEDDDDDDDDDDCWHVTYNTTLTSSFHVQAIQLMPVVAPRVNKTYCSILISIIMMMRKTSIAMRTGKSKWANARLWWCWWWAAASHLSTVSRLAVGFQHHPAAPFTSLSSSSSSSRCRAITRGMYADDTLSPYILVIAWRRASLS